MEVPITAFKILIADDDSVSRLIFQRCLQDAGYEVTTATDGVNAVEKMTDEHALAILDLDMPRLSGVECLRRLRGKFGNAEFLIVSGVGQIRDAVQAMKDGAFEL